MCEELRHLIKTLIECKEDYNTYFHCSINNCMYRIYDNFFTCVRYIIYDSFYICGMYIKSML